MRNFYKFASIFVGVGGLLCVAWGVIAQNLDIYFVLDDSPDRIEVQEVKLRSEPVNAATEIVAPLSCATSHCAYFPMIETLPTLSMGKVLHRADCEATNNRTDVSNGGTISLPSGLRALTFEATAGGYGGSSYNNILLFNGVELNRSSSSGPVASNDEKILTKTLFYGTEDEPCQSPLPNGTYTARFFIDGQLITEYTAVIN